MDSNEILFILNDLDLTKKDAAFLLGVHGRTMRRWLNFPEQMPLSTVETLYSWQYFEKNGLSWPLYKHHRNINRQKRNIHEKYLKYPKRIRRVR